MFPKKCKILKTISSSTKATLLLGVGYFKYLLFYYYKSILCGNRLLINQYMYITDYAKIYTYTEFVILKSTAFYSEIA